jgi:chromosome segregation ATPase
MPIEPPDMSTPVTRGELRGELRDLETRIDAKFESIDAKFESIDAKFESIDAKFEALRAEMRASEQRLSMELAHHANAIVENVAKHVGVVDDKYADLPRRVTRLEGAVFKAKRR